MVSTGGISVVPLTLPGSPKREILESRHQELLKTQKHLQEQYDRLQRLHSTQVTPVPIGSDVLQLAVPHCTSQMVDKESVASNRQFIAQKSTETCNLQKRENKNFENIENEEMKNKAIDNGTTKILNQPTDNADEKKEQLLITPSINDADREKGRDYTFISLLLDNAHETDIL